MPRHRTTTALHQDGFKGLRGIWTGNVFGPGTFFFSFFIFNWHIFIVYASTGTQTHPQTHPLYQSGSVGRIATRKPHPRYKHESVGFSSRYSTHDPLVFKGPVRSGLVFCLSWKRPRPGQVLTFRKSEKTRPGPAETGPVRSFAVFCGLAIGLNRSLPKKK
jgi:hypothetical protein